MKTVSGANFTDVYGRLARLLHEEHQYTPSPRGMESKEIIPVGFDITTARDRLPRVKARKFSPAYCVAEWLWYLSGSNDVRWIGKYAPFWLGVSDDGQTAASAYGSRLFRKHPAIGGDIIQWSDCVSMLKKDPDTRRAVMHLKTPTDCNPDSKDIPCTLAVQFFIRNGALDCVVDMRSSDLILGIVYDVPVFTLFQEMMANELGISVGTYSHFSHSLHVYARHYEMLSEIAASASGPAGSETVPMAKLPKGPIPIDQLVVCANDIFVSSDPDELHRHVTTLVENEYFRDWLRVLAIKRIDDLEKQSPGVFKMVTMKGKKLRASLIQDLHPSFRWFYEQK